VAVLGQAVDLLVRALVLLDALAGHQPLAAELGERRVDRSVARADVMAEGLFVAVIVLVAGLVALGQHAEAEGIDVHGFLDDLKADPFRGGLDRRYISHRYVSARHISIRY
jgi:hypothetical protein